MVESTASVLRHKIDTFQKDPLGSARYKMMYQARQLLNRWGQYKLRQHDALGALVTFLANRPPSAIPPNYADLWFLYQAVRKRKPRVIIEFGSGCSTAILAQALQNNHQESSTSSGYLYSIDADQYWSTLAAQAIPEPLRKFCETSYSPVQEIEYEGILGFRHAQVPDVVPNFLYLDGPGLTPERQVAVDVLDIEARLQPDFYMVIDGRKANSQFLQKHLKRRYRVTEREIYFHEVFELVG